MMATALALGGCATRQAPPPAAIAATPSLPPRPLPPSGYVAAQAMPAVDAEGRYVTPNQHLSPAATVWHVRSALNVAALACRGGDEAALIATYNVMLKQQAAPFAKANKAVQAEERQGGGDWQTRHDVAMTKLYNFFAQPFAQAGFCTVAGEALRQAATLPPADLERFSMSTLVALEEPFLDAFAASDGYRQQLAAWDGRYGTGRDAGPQLAYAALGPVIDWTPQPLRSDQRIALAR